MTLILPGLFSGLRLLLAAIGAYGVTSYGVAQRAHEIAMVRCLAGPDDRAAARIVRAAAPQQSGHGSRATG